MAGENALETPSFDFGIQETMEMGLGNPELLQDLISPETSTANPNELEPIEKTVPPITPPNTKEVKKPEEEKKPEEAAEDGKKSLTSFLEEDEDEDEDESTGKKPAEPKKPEEAAAEPEDEPSQFTALAKDLFQLGVFTKDEDEEEEPIVTPQDFLKRFNAEKEKGAIEMVNNFVGRLGEDYQNAFEAIFVKGVKPNEYFGTYNKIVDFVNLDLSTEENQVAVIRQALLDQEFEPEDITTEIERLKNYGDLETVAAKHHKVLVKKQATRLQQLEQQAQQEQEQKQAARTQYINNVRGVLQDKLKAKEFDGIPLNPNLVNELHDFLLVDKYRTTSGETLTDFDKVILDLKRPENHAQKVKIALLLKILEKDPTLSTIQQTGVSKKSDKLFGELAKQKKVESGSASSNKSNNEQSWRHL